MAQMETHHRQPLPEPAELASLPPDGGSKYNRLVFEKSPYLLQHAANPVDWWPWSAEAFEEARRQNKPVFLSIGYSTCHWCHVMERESFEDNEVAALLNKHFIPIKVDREERPDVDQVYMTVTIRYSGNGGWPMTVLLTPDQKPFFAGTYFPKQGRFGRPGMTELVPYFGELWKNEREKIEEVATMFTQDLSAMSGSFAGGALDESTLDDAFQQFAARFDHTYGGFEGRHKFPTPHNLIFLTRYWHRTGNADALEMVEKTLQEMRLGGIFDHVGLGFHRYSTDPVWLLPHFEKMLYDQALLALAYIEAFMATGKKEYAATAREIFEYVLRDMTSPEGGFYSAEDADSEGVEGKFYIWSVKEVRDILGAELGDLFIKVYNFEEGGNFTEESTGERTGENIPHLRKPLAEIARDLKIEPALLEARMAEARNRLFAVREKRVHPLKDDKVLTDWNGLMIAALARGARALGDDKLAGAAMRAADFALSTLRDVDGKLHKRFRTGEAGLPAHLEDYAFLAWGFIELYEATFAEKYLLEANKLAGQLIGRFHDTQHGGFFMTAADGEQLIVRSKDAYDGVIPSGNSVAAYVLLKLARMLGKSEYEALADEALRAFSAMIEKASSNFSFSMIVLDFAIGPSKEIVLAGTSEAIAPMAEVARKTYAPRSVLLHRASGDDCELQKLCEYLAAYEPIDAGPAAYVCESFACEAPVTTADALREKLRKK